MILSCHQITYVIGEQEILDQISFSLEDHEKAAIIGINGAGKTTLLRILAGEISPEAGTFTLGKDKSVGYLAQYQDITSDDIETQDGQTEQSGEGQTGQSEEEKPKETEDGMTIIDENTRVISLSSKILEQLNKDYDPEQYGIEVRMVQIKKLDLPDENKDAVYNRMITERKNIAAAYRAQGESEAQKIRNTTDRETAVMLSEAEANADRLEAEGEAEYMRILSDAYNDPDKAEYYLFVRQLDAAKKSLENGNTTLFLDSDSPLASIFETNE